MTMGLVLVQQATAGPQGRRVPRSPSRPVSRFGWALPLIGKLTRRERQSLQAIQSGMGNFSRASAAVD